jgi:REP element-mobilizing transposase RayT
MGRPLRLEFEGAFYHIVSRGNAKQAIFLADDDRRLFLGTLGRVTKRHNWILHAYCLMENHFHLLVETPDGNLSRGMHNLNGIYCRAYNSRHNRVGHLFQGRFHAALIDQDEYFQVVARYIALNPVRAKMVDDPLDYMWSSYRDTIGARIAPIFLTTESILRSFSDDETRARNLYREFVLGGLNEESDRSLENRSILGSRDFLDRLEKMLAPKRTIREIRRKDRYANRPQLSSFLDRNAHPEERNKRIFAAFQEFGYKQKEIADYLCLAPSTVSEIIKGLESASQR